MAVSSGGIVWIDALVSGELPQHLLGVGRVGLKRRQQGGRRLALALQQRDERLDRAPDVIEAVKEGLETGLDDPLELAGGACLSDFAHAFERADDQALGEEVAKHVYAVSGLPTPGLLTVPTVGSPYPGGE